MQSFEKQNTNENVRLLKLSDHCEHFEINSERLNEPPRPMGLYPEFI